MSTFTSIGRDEYTNLLAFLLAKNVNVVGVRYADPQTKSGRRTNRGTTRGKTCPTKRVMMKKRMRRKTVTKL